MLEMKNFLFYFFIVWTENTIKMYGNQNCLVTNNLQILILWAMKCTSLWRQEFKIMTEFSFLKVLSL